jgi:hypothetical protein
MKNWKTTANGFLAAFYGAVGPLSGFLAAVQSMRPTPNYTLAICGAGLTCAALIARAWIGLLQNDAEPTFARTTTLETTTTVTPAPPTQK